MSVSSPTPTFKVGLTPEEKKLYSQLFKSLDPEGTGIISGEKARSTFEKSGLPPAILGEIWQIADHNNLGFLTQFGFCHAMRLIGYTQSGQHPTSTLGDTPGPMPKFANLNLAQPPRPLQPQSTNSSFMQSQPSAIVPQNTATLQSKPQDPISSISSADYQKFSQLFIKTVGTPRGELNGNRARDIFMKAKLPTAALGQIWSLVDRDNSGKLDMPSFVIAMHLIHGLLSGVIKQLPPFLSENVWQSVQSPEANFQSPGSRQASYNSINSQQTTVRHPSSAGTQNQFQQPQSPHRDVSVSQDANSWTVTRTMKQQYDSIFDNLDKSKKGHLSPDQVASILMTSKLNQQDLASVWDLADIQNTGIFTKLEFSIALFLVNKKLAGDKLPNIVPDSLIESIKSVGEPQPQSNSDASQIKPIEKQKTAMDDLVDIFGPGANTNNAASTVSNAGSSAPTGANRSLETRTSSSDLSHPGDLPKVRKNLSQSFKPTSSFGQTLINKHQSFPAPKEEKVEEDLLGEDVHHEAEQRSPPPVSESKKINYDALRSVPPPPVKNQPPTFGTASSPMKQPTSSGYQSPPPIPAHNNAGGVSREGSFQHSFQQQRSLPNQNDDLLADADPEISGQLSQATSDIANLSNQIKSLTTQTSGLHEKKSRAEQELTKILSTKQDIGNKLKTLRSSYESEVQQFNQVEANLATAKEETEALRSETSISEAKFNSLTSDLNERQVTMENLQKENASLKEKLGNLNAENAELQKQTQIRASELQQLTNKLSVTKSQVQVSLVKNQELKDKLLEMESSNKSLQEEFNQAEQQQSNSERESKDLAQQHEDLSKFQPSKENSGLFGNAKGMALGAGVGSAIAGVAGMVGHSMGNNESSTSNRDGQQESYNSNDTNEQRSFSSKFKVSDLVDEVRDKPSADLTGIDDLQDINKDASSFPTASRQNTEQATDELSDRFPRLSTNESTEENNTNATAPSSTVMTEDTDGNETPVTSPSNSDFQFPEGSNTGIGAGMAGMPGMLVGVQRTDSLTSSVQNNAALSVRDDNIDEVSDRDTIDNLTAPNTAGTAVATHNESKNFNNQEESSDKLSSGVESFEMVNSDDARDQYNSQDKQFETGNKESFVIQNPSNVKEDTDLPHPSIEDEFPPIKELDYDESSSDDESQDDNFDDAVDNLPSQTKESHGINEAPRDDFDSAFNDLQPAAPENHGKDLFADEFDDLEVAQVDDNLNDEFEGQNQEFGLSEDFTNEPLNQSDATYSQSNRQSSEQPNKNSNDEWEQLFAGFGNSEPTSQEHSQPAVSDSNQYDSIQELVGMGFDENTAAKALAKENGNLEAATNYLLDNA
ncbi:DEHA2C03014p [Debaryomyces hansenii CBS767]|uniref:DEHA2C03014p n=1 Tax=Debaryomyces hansenii (strain ATCC 36239 / CBS 767 / BCRC 21394 / JCM 1990 / NBRC 0083 / IGC 2968) TaxID=284592 RepID=B5RT65_DEBHA|nr:DEHA2C03014p [Debaryomyces hansenii CBS767]CAR65527.1 DEHA2C03014p [Debaryomyces hansenii CBS767]|eukprot:XP_002770160.1 DEHA2C03014p [Debaryomyces hansenii CBS767]